jgi:hypothetical protein
MKITTVGGGAMANPALTAVLGRLPTIIDANETLPILPTTTTVVSAASASQCFPSSYGSTSIPTETKKIAAKMSRTGSIKCSTCTPCPDSATSEPARNAPSATV